MQRWHRGDSHHGGGGGPIQPQIRLEPSVNPNDASLLTAPLSTVLNAATDSLYTDLHTMVTSELTIAVPTNTSTVTTNKLTLDSQGGDNEDDEPEDHHTDDETNNHPTETTSGGEYHVSSSSRARKPPTYQTRTAKMASLSFAQRRHEVSHRIATHATSIAHVAALVASYLPDSGCKSSVSSTSSSMTGGRSMRNRGGMPSLYALSSIPSEEELTSITLLCSQSLQHVQESWVSADEAQDALYFHHMELWKARKHPHDILGALEVVCGGGNWSGVCKDVRLEVDRYECSEEKGRSKSEVLERLRSAVRGKLIMGEVGFYNAKRKRLWMSTTTTTTDEKDKLTNNMEDDGEEKKTKKRKKSDEVPTLPWKIVLEKGGGVVKLMHGKPRVASTVEQLHFDNLAKNKQQDTKQQPQQTQQHLIYPIEARLTVLSEQPPIPTTVPTTITQTATMTSDEKTTSSSSSATVTKAAAPWTLLSIHVNVSAKTGESNHQLDMSKRQMYDLHRLCVKAMSVEENRHYSLVSGAATGRNASLDRNAIGGVPRPLDRLFETSHIFSISLQMEILSCQAEALRKGAWSNDVGAGLGGGITGGGVGGNENQEYGIAVTPVQFLNSGVGTGVGAGNSVATSTAKNVNTKKRNKITNDSNENQEDTDTDDDEADAIKNEPLAVMAIHFWQVDGRYGSPQMGDLTDDDDDRAGEFVSSNTASSTSTSTSSSHLLKTDNHHSKRLTLEIRAVPRLGIQVALSGGDGVMEALGNCCKSGSNGENSYKEAKESHQIRHLRRNMEKLLSSIQNPFSLSASDALLAATVICAERRCRAVVAAIQRARDGDKAKRTLPSWIHLEAECGSISVSVRISYFDHSKAKKKTTTHATNINDGDTNFDDQADNRRPVLLFRLACDSRTGRFVTVFPRPLTLLRSLACNEPSASETQLLRQAAAAAASSMHHRNNNASSMSAKRRNAAAAAGKELTGRAVRDAFEGLNRSMDILGRRAGVGGKWNDTDGIMARALREKAVEQACGDVRSSLMSCAAIAAVYGVAALALGIAGGAAALPDMAGGPIEQTAEHSGTSYLAIPPLSIIMNQQMVEKTIMISADEKRTTMLLQRQLVATSCCITDDSVTLHCFEIDTQFDSVTSLPNRIHCVPLPLSSANDQIDSKIMRENGDINEHTKEELASSSEGPCQLMEEVFYLANRLDKTFDSYYNG